MVNSSDIITDPYSINDDFSRFYKGLLRCKNIKKTEIELHKSDKYVLVYLKVSINLPGRRSNMNIDIREVEPILLQCSINEIQYKAPFVFSGRSDFPADKLPHTARVPDWPAYICLHRGNIDDWYIEHSVEDFINRIRTWFSDAASGRLIRPGDDFEPMLLHRDMGNAVYSYDKITEFIERYWNSNNGESGFAYTLCSLNNNKESNLLDVSENSFSVQIIDIFPRKKLTDLLLKYRSELKKNKYFIGILAWHEKSFCYYEYFKFPYIHLSDLYEFNERIGNEFKRALNILKNNGLKNYVLLVSAVNRPTKLIGYNKNIELFNFVFHIEKIVECKSVRIKEDKSVLILNHLEPLTKGLATNISNQTIHKNPKILIVGAGALGSKIIFHLARNGYTNLAIIDDDKLCPHNLIRHALFSESVSKNKSQEIVSKLNNMYLLDSEKCFQSYNFSFIDYAQNNDLSQYDILLDFSASKSVFTFISKYKEQFPKTIIRAELANEGKLGLLIIEGEGRNPKMDELQMSIFNHSLSNTDISNWLKKYKKLRDNIGEAGLEDITIGMGCNTNTMKLSDDIISYHAAIFSNYIKKILARGKDQGEFLISHFDENDYSKNYCKSVSVKEFLTTKADNAEWTTKIYKDTYKEISKELRKNSPKETGGVLLGYINIKEKTIYVTNIFIPKDNKCGPYLLRKGSEGTYEYLKSVSDVTGNMLKYVGDWHTHPNHNTNMSDTDKKSLLELQEHLKDIPHPAHIMIFNETSFNSYILE
ncbi:thiamine biosynthesis protein ThiF [Clostridium botulinum]|uniref:ThiF family adenylyltransferase n=1 Tax=Clostridium botulinum TaxID=1491 RepID=UPI001A92D466|nr:ThiF family adenylyltransferase [Clostridium botulinum]MBO0526680.1 thiamine biosynthesis protein ThiF [Clostridium botulinum]MBO0526990.1 thiamine biosynthesis protein ThiF [Clostridium botulinum]MBO0532497.1 thiamine biosynthesis protein ThiF [Clostridium botulinum]MBO0534394.1 thiamine biosynthesis protein ThiF [Clostridium botulinum]MBO0538912.1 thiamine biosynthesis protein ThiF [Clostridium botulinum]